MKTKRKTKNKIFGFACKAVCDFALIALAVLVVTPFSSFHGDLAEAEGFENSEENLGISYPYTYTFTISAYYSPLPCQEKYATGSYEGDIHLNGNGVHGADGTDVYPGMIAAPKTYQFGTKMYIPDVGIVSVHDRGGAIVASNGQGGFYDRLDIWMGYGDKGLRRALNWGKRTLDVTVYGVNDSVVEQISLSDYSPDEAVADECTYSEPEVIATPEPQKHENSGGGNDISSLQKELQNLNFYKGEINGNYDELTKHAVFKFQQSQSLIADESSLGAGVFGPKTKDRLNEIVSSRDYTTKLIAEATAEKIENETVLLASAEDPSENVDFSFGDGFSEEMTDVLLASELSFGETGAEVTKLQKFLNEKGYFDGSLFTDYYGEKTKEAVIQFQIKNGIILNPEDVGAGRVGPGTLNLINSL